MFPKHQQILLTGRSDSCGFPMSWGAKLSWKLKDPRIFCLLSSLAQLNLDSTTSFDPQKRSHSGLRKKNPADIHRRISCFFFLKNMFWCFLITMDACYLSMAFLRETLGVFCHFKGKQIRKPHVTQLFFFCVCVFADLLDPFCDGMSVFILQ